MHDFGAVRPQQKIGFDGSADNRRNDVGYGKEASCHFCTAVINLVSFLN
jgi:hypothetical protein